MLEVMQSGLIRWGDVVIEYLYDPKDPPSLETFEIKTFISYKSAEEMMGWRRNSAREKLEAKSLKASQGEDFTLGKTNTTDSQGRKNLMSVMSFETFNRIVQWQAFDQNNPKAKSMLVAGYRDSIRSIALETITGKSPTIQDRNTQIQKDRDEFYRQYAAGISDAEWLAGDAHGQAFLAGVDWSNPVHAAMFGSGWQPALETHAALWGKNLDLILEEMETRYGTV